MVFESTNHISGFLTISGRRFSLRGELPVGGLGKCQRIVVGIFGQEGTQTGALELFATHDPFEHKPALYGTATIGQMSVEIAAWRRSSLKAGDYLSGRVSFPMDEAA